MQISISDNLKTYRTVEPTTVDELAKYAMSNHFSCGVFKDGARNLANFIKADCIALDIDNDKTRPTLTLADAKRLFIQYKHVILTTRNHQKEKNGVTTDRFRIVLFLSEPITSVNDFYATWYWLADQVPASDIQCKDASRLWYPHADVASLNEDGKLIRPITYTEPEVPEYEGRPALPGETGELSKDTLKLIAFGIEPGNRNGAVYKAAKDFQQNLYNYEEAEKRILTGLSTNDVINATFTLEEARAAVRSAYSKDAKHNARLVEIDERAFTYISAKELLETPDTEADWLIDGFLLTGGTSIFAGAPKIGKTTIVRQLALSVLRGHPFLELNARKGRVIHYSMDEKNRTLRRQYRKLGLKSSDPLTLCFGNPRNSNYMVHLEEDIYKIKPSLVIVDTLFDMLAIDDTNNYAPLKRALGKFNTIAEQTQCHIMFIHHASKPNPNYSQSSGNAILGSTAIFGAVDTAVVFEQLRDSDRRLITAQGRDIEGGFNRQLLTFNKEHQLYSIEHTVDGIDF